MIELELARMIGDPPEATLMWDEETGGLTGPLAGRVVELAEAYRKIGSVVTAPYPTTYQLEGDPLRSRRDLALVLSTLWAVPEALRHDFPEPPTDEPMDVDVLY